MARNTAPSTCRSCRQSSRALSRLTAAADRDPGSAFADSIGRRVAPATEQSYVMAHGKLAEIVLEFTEFLELTDDELPIPTRRWDSTKALPPASPRRLPKSGPQFTGLR